MKLDQLDADAQEQSGHEVVYAQRQRQQLVDLLRGGPAERRDVFFRDQWVGKSLVLEVKLDDGARQLQSLGKAQALGKLAGGRVAHHHLKRDRFDFADQLLAHVHAADEMGGHADIAQALEKIFGDAVVQRALAFHDRCLARVGIGVGGVVLEMLDERARLGSFVERLALAIENQSATVHEIRVLVSSDPARLRSGAPITSQDRRGWCKRHRPGFRGCHSKTPNAIYHEQARCPAPLSGH